MIELAASAFLAMCWPVDADTVRCEGMDKTVRLAGIDAAELFKPACPSERRLAEIATLYTWALLSDGLVEVTVLRKDKYPQRVVGRITHPVRGDLGTALLNAGLARRYDGGRRLPWC